KFAAVERALPGALYVRIVEREPVALWQHEGVITPVDDNGTAMNGIAVAPGRRLPLIIGDDAPKHVGDLLQLLALEPDLTQRFAAAAWVGDRRWNIRLHSPIGVVEVKLPEEGPAEAWKKLAELQARRRLLDRDVKVIDMRLEGRMFIRLAPEGGKATGARET
ncbi:MAG: cell division protein FtsQ, partial [Pseudomonadota bacterium]|nr:cell division protein FtsQ [Pseudomonadota bacterium]